MDMEPVSIQALPHEFIDKDGQSVTRPGMTITWHVHRGISAAGLFPGDRVYIDGRLYYEHPIDARPDLYGAYFALRDVLAERTLTPVERAADWLAKHLKH